MSPCCRAGMVFLVVGAASGCGAGTSGVTPTQVVEQLYTSLQSSKVSGAPAPSDLATIAPYISAELATLLRQARELHDMDVARSPGEKPAFAEGDLFSSLFEGTTSFEVLADTADGPMHRLAVRFTYAAVPPPVRWTDQVILIEERGRFVVADVRYGGAWDFSNKGTLVASLRGALAAK